MQREPERDLIVAWQQGNLTAARQLVAMLQSEALNVAYLLTGGREESIALAESGFLALFEHSRSGDPDIDRRGQLLTLMAQSYVRGDYKARVEHVDAGLPLEPAPARFNVDTRRTLLLAALGRLETRERAALVLHDFSGLEASEMSKLVEKRGDALIAPMDTARVRVRKSLDISASEHLRRPFVEAAFDAPRADLWPRLEEPLAEIVRRDRNQSRIISLSIVAVVVLALIGGSAALFGDSLFGGSDEASGMGALSTEAPTSLPAGPTVAQSIAPPATPTQAGPAFPDSSVPGWLLMETWHQRDEVSEAYRSLTVFDPRENRTRRLPSNSPIHLAAGSDQIHFSPDGYQMVVFREEVIDEQIHYFLMSFSTDRISRQWETEVLVVDHDPDQNPTAHTPARMMAAITDDRVYIAMLTTDEEPTLAVHSYFRRNGMPRGSTEIVLPRQNRNSHVFQGDVQIYAPPESSNLYVIVESFGDSAEEWRAALMTFDRTEMSLIRERSVSADQNQGYWLWSSQMTADGSALFGVHRNRGGTESRVQFLELETGEITTIPLPFTIPGSQDSSGLMPITSHDGERIFILNQSGSNVAVVNLAERRIERVFPLDRRGFEPVFQPDRQGLMFGYWATFSADGSRLYIASWDREPAEDQPAQSGIWVVDTSRWKLTHFVPLDGFVNGVFLSPTESAVYVQIWTANDSEPTHEIVKIATDGDPAIIETLDLPQPGDDYVSTHTPAQYFRAQHGHSPTIDQVELADSTDLTTLPRIEVTTGGDIIVPNHNASIEVRVLDPESGEPLSTERPDVRFDPAAGVAAFVYTPDQERQIVVLGEVRPGVYRGSVALPVDGRWMVDVVLTDDDGEPWVASAAGQIDVSPVLAGSDGRSYAFRIATDPSRPIAGEDTRVRLSLIDVETGDLLPEGVTASIEGEDDEVYELPDRIDIPFTHSDPGYVTARMNRTETNGVYEGTVQFWSTGSWSAGIRVQPDDETQITFPANNIEVTE